MPERRITNILVLATAAQVLGLWFLSPMSNKPANGFMAAGILAFFAVALLWHARRLLPAHIDMLVIMFSFGGFGMLLGSWADAGLQYPLPFLLVCPMHGPQGSWLNWMSVGMLAFAIPPSVAWSRCLLPLRGHSGALITALAIDAVGMFVGMELGGRWLSRWCSVSIGNSFAGMHVAMLGGMVAGMAAAMPVRDWVLLRWFPHVLAPAAAPQPQH